MCQLASNLFSLLLIYVVDQSWIRDSPSSEHKSVQKVSAASVHLYVHFQNTKKLECIETMSTLRLVM